MPFDYRYQGTVFTETRTFEVAREAVLLNIFADGDWDNLVGPRLLASDVGMNVTRDDVEIRIGTAPNDTILSGGLYYHAQSADDGLIIILLSGSGGPASNFNREILRGYLLDNVLRSKVTAVLSVDYRGFGRSRGGVAAGGILPPRYIPGSKALYTDAAAMLEFVRKDMAVPARKIVLHGYSLGSGPACELAASRDPAHQIGGLVLHGPMKSIFWEAAKATSSEVLGFNTSNNPSAFVGGAIGTAKFAAASLLSAGLIPGAIAVGAATARGNVGFDNIGKIRRINVPILLTSGPRDKMWNSAKSLRDEMRAHRKQHLFSVHNMDHFQTDGPFDVNPVGGEYVHSAIVCMYTFLNAI